MKSSKVEDADMEMNRLDLNNKKNNDLLREHPPLESMMQKVENEEFEINYNEEDFDPLPERLDKFSSNVLKLVNLIGNFYLKYNSYIWNCVGLLIFIGYLSLYGYFSYCKSLNGSLTTQEPNIRFIWVSIIIIIAVFYNIISQVLKIYDKNINLIKMCKKQIWWDKFLEISFYVACCILSLIVVIYIIYAAVKFDPYNLVSLSGIFLLLLFSYVFSVAPHMVNWRPVLVAILMQFIFAIIILATEPGYVVFRFLGDRVSDFLDHTESGVQFVFGKDYYRHYFAMRILPIIMYISSITAILYYLGVIQKIVIFLGTGMQFLLGTTCGESMNAIANIFLGMTESPLLIRPMLGRMTNSELHAVMTGGFATIAGSVLASYIKYGAPANHLISASVMSAPAALAVSKLMYPETKKSKTTKDDKKIIPKCNYNNIVEAATIGAMDSLPIVGSILATVICFLAILSFFNGILSYLGERACLETPLSFEVICSYLFWPLTLFMGVKIEDCRKVAELIGIKTFLNEFIAYEKFDVMKKNKQFLDALNSTDVSVKYDINNIIVTFVNGTVVSLKGGILHAERSLVIATYALCGFANVGSMGILLSSFTTLIPHRRKDLTSMIVRAMIAGNVACFLTASIAGLFYQPVS